MKDSKIDNILDDHIADYDLPNEYEKALILLGENFVDKLSEIYDADYTDRLEDAKNLLRNYSTGNYRKNKDFEMFRHCLLESFIMKPYLDIEDRKIYTETYMFCIKHDDCGKNCFHDEEITKKSILWYEAYSKNNSDDDMSYIYEIAALAIKDQVYTKYLEVMEEKTKCFKNTKI